MALVSLGTGLHLGCSIGGGWPLRMSQSTEVVDAAGESLAIVGRIQLTSGPGTSKTISSAGGSASFTLFGVTFASGSTTVRASVQDVTSGGVEDGTADVHGTVTGGGGGFTGGAVNTIAMGTGTKTIAHGDLVAVVIEMTARGGSDSLTFITTGGNNTGSMPFASVDSGSGPTKTSKAAAVMITFDDGTLGHFGEHYVPAWTWTGLSYDSSSSPNEYAFLFQVPFPATVSRLTGHISDLDTGENGALKLYSDPLGTPVEERSATVTADESGQAGSTDGSSLVDLGITAYTLSRNTWYAVAYKPSTTGARTLLSRTLGAAGHRATCWLGTNMSGGSRSSGAFTANNTVIPALGFVISEIDDGTGSGGGGSIFGSVVR
jgi:hypothetical protein